MAYTTDEINVVRLVRRLEKTIGKSDEWTAEGTGVEEVELRVRKTVETVKFARRLIKTVEIESEDTPARFKRLNDAKMQLDGMERFLKGVEKSLEGRRGKVESVSLLSMLPVPSNGDSRTARQLTIIPPEADEVSPSLISTALPSLLPVNATETGKSSSFSRTFTGTGNTTEELSLQLEQMARQLKRNAIHFSTSLANDKAVIEDAASKLESNFGVMEGQRVKLRERRRAGWMTTCLVIGIVIGVFVLMVVVIRIL